MEKISKRKSDEIYSKLKEDIITGVLTPGEKLSFRKVAQNYNVSMMPVREAMTRLHVQDLITINKKTIRIKKLTASEVEDIFQMRFKLEAMAVEKAMFNIGDQEKDELLNTVAAMDRMRHQPAEWQKLNKQFHLQLYRYANSKILQSTLENLWSSVEAYMHLYVVSRSTDHTLDISHKEHLELIYLVYRKEAAQSVDLLYRHLMNTKQVILQELKQLGG
ncbi:GntR family transcriptional regulator [Geomicrobium sediminis]|uniref:DNA-binding GntR family transcriptional regulator n=1 Tax=Geomicrobium sediminis TaxID=1347788 RepID=A0ABS2PC72_9BACL|nr:GntR family transcriptional regulator [Geomicrobium sediminis]MBM7633035.1 DNA-binding GntR family transcriptional regulator [Geomicrobium sediminis]